MNNHIENILAEARMIVFHAGNKYKFYEVFKARIKKVTKNRDEISYANQELRKIFNII